MTALIWICGAAIALFVAFATGFEYANISRSSKNPPDREKFGIYAKCLLIPLLFCLLGNTNAWRVIIFIALCPFTLLGASKGLSSDADYPKDELP